MPERFLWYAKSTLLDTGAISYSSGGGVRPQGGGLTKGGEWGGYCFDLLLYWSHAGGASASAPISASAFADSWFCFYLLLLLLPTTRNVLTFVNRTTIAWCQGPSKKAEFWRYAIAVVFTNVRTLRVLDCLRVNLIPRDRGRDARGLDENWET